MLYYLPPLFLLLSPSVGYLCVYFIYLFVPLDVRRVPDSISFFSSFGNPSIGTSQYSKHSNPPWRYRTIPLLPVFVRALSAPFFVFSSNALCAMPIVLWPLLASVLLLSPPFSLYAYYTVFAEFFGISLHSVSSLRQSLHAAVCLI